MTKYDLILLDNDNTLFDFDKAQKRSMTKAFEFFSIPMEDHFISTHRSLSKGLWDDYEKGLISKQRLTTLRFEKLFYTLGLSTDPQEFNRVYWSYLSEANDLIDGAETVCSVLSQHCILAVATNGFSSLQRSHVNNTPLKKYITHIIISDDLGYQKPQKEFFDCALKVCGVSDRSRTLMVGDSYSADIKGAYGAGIDCCWFNPKGYKQPDLDVAIDYEIRSLRQLTDIILN